jgi:hypothetical protein
MVASLGVGDFSGDDLDVIVLGQAAADLLDVVERM